MPYSVQGILAISSVESVVEFSDENRCNRILPYDSNWPSGERLEPLKRVKHRLVIPIQFPVSGCMVVSRWILDGVYDYLRPGFQN